MRHGSFPVFLASLKVIVFILTERASKIDESLTLTYARPGLDGLEGLNWLVDVIFSYPALTL